MNTWILWIIFIAVLCVAESIDGANEDIVDAIQAHSQHCR